MERGREISRGRVRLYIITVVERVQLDTSCGERPGGLFPLQSPTANSRGAVALTMALMGEWRNIEDETEECVQNIEGEAH